MANITMPYEPPRCRSLSRQTARQSLQESTYHYPGHTQCKGASRCKCRCKPQTLHPHLDAIKLLASASAVMQMQLSEPASASAVMQMQIELHLRCASKMQGPWQGPWVPHPGARGPAAHIFWRLRRGAWCLSERLVDCVGVGYSRTSTSIFIMGT